MNELVKQILEFAKISPLAGFAMFFLAAMSMYYIANMVVGIVKWIAIGFRGYPPKGTKLGDDIS